MTVLLSVLARCLMPFMLIASLTTWVMLVVFVVANTASFALYAVDKRRAVRQEWRIPEYVLLLAAVPGPFGAELGRLVCRHKIRKWYFSATICAAMLGAWYVEAQVNHLMQHLGVPAPVSFDGPTAHASLPPKAQTSRARHHNPNRPTSRPEHDTTANPF